MHVSPRLQSNTKATCCITHRTEDIHVKRGQKSMLKLHIHTLYANHTLAHWNSVPDTGAYHSSKAADRG